LGEYDFVRMALSTDWQNSEEAHQKTGYGDRVDWTHVHNHDKVAKARLRIVLSGSKVNLIQG
jgi:hypothetical protein